MHESRAEPAILLGCIYLLIAGPRKWPFDARLSPSAVVASFTIKS
jgi:hypothetical protein